MEMTLNEHERRIIGVLMEKSMSQPEYYPMTANAIVAGCNQRNNRDPVMELDEVAVSATLDTLRRRGLVEQILPAPGARTDRFKHRIEVCYGWGPRERAIVAELLLRGPQTPGELRTRCSRFVAFEDLDAVHTVLEALRTCDPPVVAPLPREAGQSAIRFTHLFYPEGEQPAAPSPTGPNEAGTATATARTACPPPGAASAVAADLQDLRAQMADLRNQLGQLALRIEAIEAKQTA